MKDGFVRVAAATPEIKVADCRFNADNIISMIKDAAANDAAVIVFPELCVTGYTCGDLFLQETLLDGASRELRRIANSTVELDILAVVGAPFVYDGKLYNCAAVIQKGEILGIVPKMNIPNYSEFYEARYFSSGEGINSVICFDKVDDYCPFGEMIFRCENIPELNVGVEICEDLWVVNPPSSRLAEMGATLICNLSASDEVIGKREYRRQLVKGQSSRLICGYIYADAGNGESTTDMIYSGHNLICENGTVLKESNLFSTGIIYSEIDVKRINEERRRVTTFKASSEECSEIGFTAKITSLTLMRSFPSTPFVPQNEMILAERCEEILSMQAIGLATRMKHIGCKDAVIGLSGGLDSTLALIVTVRTFNMLKLDLMGIHTITMPHAKCTTARTKSNAEKLAEAYGTSFSEIDITAAVRQHFDDISLDTEKKDAAFENSQARERTQILMDVANKIGGIVVGTGDLSELALGWATYNGDHMSMYGVNCSIPKTLVRYLVAYEAGISDEKLNRVLADVLDTPVSPELLPSADGVISQKTEDLVGPYELHDFFLYYFMRFGYPPKKILRIAASSFDGKYSVDVIKKWLRVFVRRFFSQQFKRSCLPDGCKVGTVTLSPRGDLRMPSDAVCSLWLEDLEQ